MKSLRSTFYFLRRAAENIFENPFLNAVTIGIIAVTLFLFSAFLLVVNDLEHLFDRWGGGIRVVAYLQEGLPTEKRTTLEKKLKSRPEVGEVLIVTKDEALRRFRMMLKGNEHVIADLAKENSLPESFEIQLAKDYRRYHDMVDFAESLKKEAGIADVVYGQEWVERFSTALQIMKWVGYLFGVVMLMAAVFIISNTIKIALFARKDELRIMQLVGATPLFIKIPFVIEGSLQGLLGAVIAVAGLFGVYAMAMSRLSNTFALPEIPFLSQEWLITILIGGMLLGAAGSFVSLGRFLED